MRGAYSMHHHCHATSINISVAHLNMRHACVAHIAICATNADLKIQKIQKKLKIEKTKKNIEIHKNQNNV
jgi:hypothetical protein